MCSWTDVRDPGPGKSCGSEDGASRDTIPLQVAGRQALDLNVNKRSEREEKGRINSKARETASESISFCF